MKLNKDEQDALDKIISEEKQDILSAQQKHTQAEINVYEYLTRTSIKKNLYKEEPYTAFDRKGWYLILNKPASHKWGFIIVGFLYMNIIVALINTAMMTVDNLSEHTQSLMVDVENYTSIIFLIELFARYMVIGISSKYRTIKDYIRFTFELRTVIDIIAILPFILILLGFTGGNLQFMRILRIFRIFKIMRFDKFSTFDDMIGDLFLEHKEGLFIVYSGILIFIFFVASIIFMIEGPVQPDKFTSIPETLYWAVITFATIGYGDIYPITPLGQGLTSLLSFLGIMAYAMPGAIITAGLINMITRADETKERQRIHLDIIKAKNRIEENAKNESEKTKMYNDYLKTHLLAYVNALHDMNATLDILEKHDKYMANQMRASLKKSMGYTAFKYNNTLLLRWLKDLNN